MKLISLNAWGGKEFNALIDFLQDPANKADIYCFQEVFDTTSTTKQSDGIRANLYHEFKKLLPGYQSFFAAQMRGHDIKGFVDFPLEHGLAVFTNPDIKVEGFQEQSVIREKYYPVKEDLSDLPSNLLCFTFVYDSKKINVVNFHGVWFPGSKDDTPERLQQSQIVIDFIKTLEGEIILCGDFNLNIDTRSILMFEKLGLRNLIKDFGIKDTRGPINKQIYGGKEFPLQHFADYTFVSKGIKVQNFKVPYVAVSDHLPMVLEF